MDKKWHDRLPSANSRNRVSAGCGRRDGGHDALAVAFVCGRVIRADDIGDRQGDFTDPDASSLYALCDRKYDVIAMTDASGNVMERIEYTPYGVASPRLHEDINNDGVVNGGDIGFITNSWGATIGSQGYNPDADLNGDGVVGNGPAGSDISVVNNSFGATGALPGQISAFANTVGYSGYLYDDAINLSLARFRWYDADTGRWATSDPIRYMDSSNLYEYVVSSPLAYMDATGEGLRCFGNGSICVGGDYTYTDGDFWNQCLIGKRALDGWFERNPLAKWACEFSIFCGVIRDNLDITEALVDPCKRLDPMSIIPSLIPAGRPLKKVLDKLPRRIRKKLRRGGRGACPIVASSHMMAGAGKRCKPALSPNNWDRKAPKQVTPGQQSRPHTRYNPRTGKLETSDVEYDPFGRQRTRRDHTDHGRTGHSNPHDHLIFYRPGGSFRIRIDYWRDVITMS